MDQPRASDSATTSPFDMTPVHRRFAELTGRWRSATTTTFDPATPVDHADVDVEFETVLGGRFLRMTYAGLVTGQPYSGQMFWGWDAQAGRATLAWIDSFHTGLTSMHSEGTATDAGALDVLGSYAAGEERWGWRTVLTLDLAKPRIRAFNITPDGTQYPAVAMDLERRG